MLWLAFTVAVRRSVIRPVQALTGAAQKVAEVAGLELARVADDDAADAGPPRLREVPVTVRDEIGELAEAFNRVQNTAAALLERQVLSRRNVAEMFGNVGRRVSNLTTRQLALIDAVERGETDPALLDRLYRIDHIAVRLQRNADSLMLLAGIRETGLEASPTPLTNVARAALGQIEGYQRVRLHAETEVTVAPDIIGDLTLMLAELLENAVAFSPAGSPVEVSVRAGGDGARIEIADHGLGMSAERLAEENARLIRRERLDLVPTKVLGLFVVGILARRWGVEVILDRTPGGGVTSRVVIPSSLLLLMSPVVPVPVPVPVPASASASYASHDRARNPAAAPPRRSEAAEPTAPGALPRRIPRQEPAPAPAPAEAADEGDATARPLRRRVRGATLRTTDAEAVQRAAPAAVRPADAEEVRSALDEFEAAVERAHRDSAALTTSDTDRLDQHDLTGLPEGAEQ
jgi:two-component sensor histidine kinase